MKRSIFFKSLSIATIAVGVWGCSSKQIATRTGNEVYDDLYAQSGDVSLVGRSYNSDQNNSFLSQNPDNFDGRTSKKRAYSNNNTNNGDYYVEDEIDSNAIDSRDYQRGASGLPGYNQGYNDGYTNSQYNWGNSWNNGFNSFNRYGYGSSFGNFYSPGVTIMLGSRFGFGGYSPYSSFGYGGFSPYGFGSYGYYSSFGYGGYYDPFYSSFYNPYGYGGSYFGGGFISSPRFYSNNYSYNNSNVIGADRKVRNYGPRNNGRNSSGYNDQFSNTARPRTNNDQNAKKGTYYNDPSNVNAGSYGSGAGGGTYSARQRGGYNGNTNSPSNTQGNVLNNNQTQNNSISRGSNNNNSYYSRPRVIANENTSGNSRRNSSTPSDNSSRVSAPSYNRSSSDRINSSSGWGNSNSSSGSSGSSSFGGASSSGGSSSGGSRSSGGGGGGSRGPR